MLNDGLIAGEFAVKRHPRSGKPHERMEPQGTQRKFVKQTNQIVAPSCMGEFVKQDSVEFSFIEYPINADREQDIWLKDAADCGSSTTDVEAHGDASRCETRGHVRVAQADPGLRLALSAYTRDQSQKHRQCPNDPYDGKHHCRPALRYIPYGSANGAKRCGPSQMRRQEPIHYRARR